ncbi:sensor histidine kinase [Maribellus sediminis]|uniref:sensor histidine kinase n=1 Tax=Maribellus sediminis TaxID=2696285 RepID=UPI00142FABF6|nr:histidine kinase [Maribellus sediminis]
MKKINLILFFLLGFLIAGFTQPAANDITSLKKGDWFTIEFANQLEDYSTPVDSINYCNPINLKKLALKCEVAEISNKNLRLDFRFERVLDLSEEGRYYDSYFENETVVKNDVDLQDIVFKVEANLINDSIQFLNAGISDSDVYNYATFSRTVDIKGRSMSSAAYGDRVVLKFVRFMIDGYLKDWQKQDYNIPLLSHGDIDVADYKRYRILESNLPIEPNFQVIINIPDSLIGEEMEIFETTLISFPQDIDRRLFNQKAKKGENQLNFYLPEQKLLMLRCGAREIKFMATPNDILRVNFDADNDELYNSLVSNFQGDQEYLSHLLKEPKYDRLYPKGMEKINSLDSSIQFLNEYMEQLITTLDSFKHELSANFYKKQLMSIYYWTAAGIIYWCEKREMPPNYSEISKIRAFQNIHPLYDYVFMPDTYAKYAMPDNYTRYLTHVTYNSFRPDFESVSTNQWFTRNYNQIENYDIYDVMYWGYPKYLTLKNIVLSDLENNGIKSAQENYDKFLANCKYPPLLNEIKECYKEIRKIEQGASLLDLPLNFIKHKNFDRDNGKYKVVLFYGYTHKDEKEQLVKNISFATKKLNLKNGLEFIVVYNVERDKRFANVEFPKSETFQTTYIGISSFEKYWEDRNTFKVLARRLIVISPDNKIVTRSSNGWDIYNVISEYIEAQNQPKSHENRKAMILGAFISLVGTSLLAWLIIKINNRRIRKRESARRKLSELELKAIRSQMNPHFIFNAMGSIQNLMNHNQTEKANLYLSRFAKLMRMVLSSSNKKLVSLADELELIRLYLELEKLRIDFRYNIKLVDAVNPETEEIPGMLLQPFVENAVIHGITPKGEGNIEVEISKVGSNLVCSITDDGVGIDPEKTGNGNGLAMKFAEKRVNLLSEQLKTRMKLEVQNRNLSEGKSGTKVTLIIPVE